MVLEYLLRQRMMTHCSCCLRSYPRILFPFFQYLYCWFSEARLVLV